MFYNEVPRLRENVHFVRILFPFFFLCHYFLIDGLIIISLWWAYFRENESAIRPLLCVHDMTWRWQCRKNNKHNPLWVIFVMTNAVFAHTVSLSRHSFVPVIRQFGKCGVGGSRTTPHENNSPPDKAQPLLTRTTIPRTIPHQDNSPLGPLPRNKTTHHDQNLYGGELSSWGVVRIRV